MQTLLINHNNAFILLLDSFYMINDEIKKAFDKVKDDISFLTVELSDIKANIEEIKLALSDLKDYSKKQENNPTDDPTQDIKDQTVQQINPTDYTPFRPIRSTNLPISIGNEGVQTNKQTNQQTDQHSIISSATLENQSFSPSSTAIQTSSNLQNVSLLLESLDSIKKDLRLKFKRLTRQEITVFSSIYSLEELGEASYSSLARKLQLSESSIRDYTNKLIVKGIPILKEKLDNKRVILHISPELRKIASLDTILKLREI